MHSGCNNKIVKTFQSTKRSQKEIQPNFILLLQILVCSSSSQSLRPWKLSLPFKVHFLDMLIMFIRYTVVSHKHLNTDHNKWTLIAIRAEIQLINWCTFGKNKMHNKHTNNTHPSIQTYIIT